LDSKEISGRDGEMEKLDWPENQVLLLIYIDDEAGWIGREVGEEWIQTGSRDVNYLNLPPLSEDPYMSWVNGLSGILMKLTGAKYAMTEWIDLVEGGEKQMLVAIPYGGNLTEKLPEAHRIWWRAKEAADGYFPVGIPEGLVVKSIADLNRNDCILTALMQRYAALEAGDKLAATVVKVVEGIQ